MEYLPVSDDSLLKAAEVIRRGGLVAFPTETVYGLGADAYNANALVRVFEAKKRPRFDPLIIHIAAIVTLKEVVNLSLLNKETKHMLFLLTDKFWPGPLSIILPKSEKIPGIATSGLPTAAVRFPADAAAQKLIALSTGAIAAPSANPFGALSPTTAQHVIDGLGDKADIILDGGSCTVGLESTVLDITGEQVQILRHGGITREEIEQVINKKVQLFCEVNTKNPESFASPGQLKSHYAPRASLSVFSREEISKLKVNEKAAYIFFDEASRKNWLGKTASCIKVLSPFGNVCEAAAHLFETLHEIDKLQPAHIFCQLAPNEGLGEAINDRLRRAAG